MKWVNKPPQRGDMLRVKAGELYHFGIYAADDAVIQFGANPTLCVERRADEIAVISTNIDTFLNGGIAEVCEFDPQEKSSHRSPDETVAFAVSKIGMRGYNILHNNCEHFANECITGERICHQTEDLRAFFRNLNNAL